MPYDTNEERFLARAITLTRYEANSRRNLDFDLDLKYLVDLWRTQSGLCSLTGKPMSFSKGGTRTRTNPDVCTMDRIDPDKGYVKGNIQLVRWIVNKIKNSSTNDDFLNICREVAKNNPV